MVDFSTSELGSEVATRIFFIAIRRQIEYDVVLTKHIILGQPQFTIQVIPRGGVALPLFRYLVLQKKIKN